MNTKKAIIMNYGLMVNDAYNTLREHSNHIATLFNGDKSLYNDKDLQMLGDSFSKFCTSLKEFDSTISYMFDSTED